MTAILVQNLTKRYPGKTAVADASLAVEPSQIFGFLGPNGAGKTTTIRVLLGLLRATRGSASILSLDCWRESARIKRRVGYVPGDLRLHPWMNGRGATRIASLAHGRDLTRAAEGLAERLGLDMAVRVRAMSRGMRQKLGLILALAHEPGVLILDEPTSSLDPIVQETLARILRERAEGGAAVFFSSHTLSEVERLCDRVAIVREGRIVADESIEALRERAHRIVTLFFATPEEARRFEAPDSLLIDRREGTRVWCELRARTPELLRWLNGQPVVDVEISAPNLERVFQRFYREEGAAQRGGHSRGVAGDGGGP